MEQIFIVILVFLILLAAFDLFVGVSNDAVNFLNSAIGSRVAPFKTVMLVASIGVLVGATFSSGMMEIARSGVFNPQMFTFSEIIVIFFAVMVTDVLLLDTFNSLGMPTSTTVSIVFELLGGAVAAATFKLWYQGGSLLDVGNYINNEKALAIISGILISVVVAFVAGVVVQYITRLIFTFQYEKNYRYLGGVFGGIALTAIFYFLVMKGAKGASFMRKEYLEWINANTLAILLGMFVMLTAFFQVLITFFRVNIFKIVILAGTFALAFAFAGNDLVNFVGVPIAAYESYGQFSVSGIAPDLFTMESLKQAVQTPTAYLLLSGLIMVLTLWFSKKAHRVVQTSINLSSSTRGEQEQFGSSLPGRLVVRSALNFGKVLNQIMPASLQAGIKRRMEQPLPEKGETPLPFDQIRASINLVVASVLIASATSLKLPLSTTYVTFMVAMGSSFADGAWDRESAVYRISGVLMVIGGWFITAFTAFTACALIASFIFAGGTPAVIVLMLLTGFLLIKSNFFTKMQEKTSFGIVTQSKDDMEAIRNSIHASVTKNLDSTLKLLESGLNAFLQEDARALKNVHNESVSFFDEISSQRGLYYHMALSYNGNSAYSEVRYFYYRAFTNMKEVAHALCGLLGVANSHIANHHHVYKDALRDNLMHMLENLRSLQSAFDESINTGVGSDVQLAELSNDCLLTINQYQFVLLGQIDEQRLSLRGSELYLHFLQLGREIVNRYTLISLLQKEYGYSYAEKSKPVSKESPEKNELLLARA